jgi:hypothetical protein
MKRLRPYHAESSLVKNASTREIGHLHSRSLTN